MRIYKLHCEADSSGLYGKLIQSYFVAYPLLMAQPSKPCSQNPRFLFYVEPRGILTILYLILV